MPIEHSPGGTTFTGKGVDPFRWTSVKHQLKLESLGMKSSGGALRPRLAAELGLKPRDSYEVFFQAVTAKIDEAKAAVGRGE
jgi:hypothetical protein